MLDNPAGPAFLATLRKSPWRGYSKATLWVVSLIAEHMVLQMSPKKTSFLSFLYFVRTTEKKNDYICELLINS